MTLGQERLISEAALALMGFMDDHTPTKPEPPTETDLMLANAGALG